MVKGPRGVSYKQAQEQPRQTVAMCATGDRMLGRERRPIPNTGR